MYSFVLGSERVKYCDALLSLTVSLSLHFLLFALRRHIPKPLAWEEVDDRESNHQCYERVAEENVYSLQTQDNRERLC